MNKEEEKVMSFVTPDILGSLGLLTRDQADRAPFGIVKVDDSGKILMYNRSQSELEGIASSAAEGKSFFQEIAPCTNNKLFFGRFQEGVAKGELNAEFNYAFTYKLRPTPVKIHMLHDRASRTNWVFVQKQ